MPPGWSGGTVLYVPRGVAIDEPLHMLSALCGRRAPTWGTRLVVLEEGAEATLLAETASPARRRGGLHCGAVELIVGPGARLRYVNLQNWASGVWHFAHQRGLVDRDAAAAMDHCRAGQPVGQSQSARGAGRPRRRHPGERRHVHRRQAAPFVSHAAAPPGAALQQRSALQGRAARRLANRLAGHDQSRSPTPRRPTAINATTT